MQMDVIGKEKKNNFPHDTDSPFKETNVVKTNKTNLNSSSYEF